MLHTEEIVRANLRTRQGRRVFFLPKGDTLTPGARDWLRQEKIDILPGEEARLESYRLLNGAVLREKPEHMTHLHSDLLVEKNHPRICFRGALDTLEAELLLCALAVPRRKRELEELLALTRDILRREVLEEPLPEGKICGMTAQELRRRSHFPQDFYNHPHFMPSPEDGEAILRLNRLRCCVRETERAAVAAFLTPTGLQREDIPRALNRMSSMVYLLMIQERATFAPRNT